MKIATLDKVYTKLIDLLEKENASYMIIGGLACGVIGEARLTQDIDVLIAISQDKIKKFLKTAKSKGFHFLISEIKKNMELQGAFKLQYADFHIDFIIAGMPFEEEAFSRRRKIKLYNKKAYFPTPEDLILFKLIASRPKDILDIKAIILRHGKRLDVVYLKKWAKVISDDIGDARIYTHLEELLKE